MAISTLLSTACSSTSVSQQLQSQTVLQPVTLQEFSGTLVPGKSQMFKSLFQGYYISGGKFNVHVSTSASTSTMVSESPQRKKFRRLRVLDSQESSQELSWFCTYNFTLFFADCGS